jgi:hypothetical protein
MGWYRLVSVFQEKSKILTETVPCKHVLFSIHSSYPELVEFVSKVMPRRIVPTVECERVFLATLSVKQCLNPTKPIIPSSSAFLGLRSKCGECCVYGDAQLRR